jgi:hypothetical protein
MSTAATDMASSARPDEKEPKATSTVESVSETQVEVEEEEKDPDEKDLLHGTKLMLAFMAMMCSLFLVALDVVSSVLLRGFTLKLTYTLRRPSWVRAQTCLY